MIETIALVLSGMSIGWVLAKSSHDCPPCSVCEALRRASLAMDYRMPRQNVRRRPWTGW